MTPATVTVAIPLHGSARWVDNIAANVRALPPMVTEILISDQTCTDDAAHRLQALLADDPRVTIHAEAAGLGFAAHYQQLLEKATADLFMWMPHDDIFDPAWVPTLAAALERHPNAWLAFGRMLDVEADGVTPADQPPFPGRPGIVQRRAAIRLMVSGWLGRPFRGLCRRRQVLAAGIRMDPATSLVAVDKEWVFAVAMHGPLVYDPQAITWKRRYSNSTSSTPQWQTQRRGDETQAARRIIQQHLPAGIARSSLLLYTRAAGQLHRWRTAQANRSRKWTSNVIEKAKRILRRQRNAWRVSFSNTPKITYSDLRAFGKKFASARHTLIVYIEFPYEDLLPNSTRLPHLENDCEAYYPILAAIPDASYPAVVATGLLEHMQDPARLIRECHRILEPGGTLYLSASAVFSVHRGPDDYFHVTRYGMQVLLDTCPWQHCDIQGSCQPFKTAAILLQRILLQTETNALIRPLVYLLVKTLPLLDRFIIRQYADRSFSPQKQIDSMAPSNIQVIATK